MKKECKILKREKNKRNKEKKDTNIVAVEGDISVICNDSCISLVS